MDLISKQATAIHNSNSIQQQSRHADGKLLRSMVTICQQITAQTADLRLLILMRNQNRLKIDLNQNHKLPSAD